MNRHADPYSGAIRGWIGHGPLLWPVRVYYVVDHDPEADCPRLQQELVGQTVGLRDWGTGSGITEAGERYIGGLIWVAAATVGEAAQAASAVMESSLDALRLQPFRLYELTIEGPIAGPAASGGATR